jgi:hypothetical protein
MVFVFPAQPELAFALNTPDLHNPLFQTRSA